MKWTDDLMLQKAPLKRKQQQLAMFALHLFTGHSIQAKSIKLGTIQGYIRNVGTFMKQVHPEGVDPRFDRPGDQRVCELLTKVFERIRKYENIPDRKEPFTIEMLEFVLAWAAELGDDDCLIAALADWYIIGLHLGLRKSEWAQENDSQREVTRYQTNIHGMARAFVIIDIRVQTVGGRRYSGHTCLRVKPNTVRELWVKFRTQKNGRNGEERMFTRTQEDGERCMTQAIYRVLQRFVRLMGTEDKETPLAVYRADNGNVQLITPGVVEDNMRLVAARVHDFDPVKDHADLMKWSCHSLRIGACVLLHSMGYNREQLMWLLRWQSDAFLAYLRNLAGLADRHSMALDKAAGMPAFFN